MALAVRRRQGQQHCLSLPRITPQLHPRDWRRRGRYSEETFRSGLWREIPRHRDIVDRRRSDPQERHFAIGRVSFFDGYSIPYGDRVFDLAILSHVIEHVEFPRKLLYEAARVAKYIFIEVPLEDTMRLGRDFVPDGVGHINFYSATTVRRLAQTRNLEVLDQIVTTPSKAVHTYRKGRRGSINYFIKRCGLRLLPGVATAVCVYHSSLVCRMKKQ